MTCMHHIHAAGGAVPFDCPGCVSICRAVEDETVTVYGQTLEQCDDGLTADEHARFWAIAGRLRFDILADYSESAEDTNWLHALAERIAERRVIALARQEAT